MYTPTHAHAKIEHTTEYDPTNKIANVIANGCLIEDAEETFVESRFMELSWQLSKVLWP